MSTLAFNPANDDFRPMAGDAVAAHFATRRLRRGLSAAASCLAVLVLSLVLLHGFQAGRETADSASIAIRL